MDMSLSKLWQTAEDREACVLQSIGLQRVGYDLVTEHTRIDLFFSFFLLGG